MQFRYPELLYGLLLVLIPILVHLFQFRKFKKEQFTNVAFLKQLQLQTRKSNSIKKWLVLLSRIGIIVMAVLAFAQPFFTKFNNATQKKENLIYLDNSFSMQAKGASGPLLKQAIQELIENVPKETSFTLVTNTDTYRDVKIEDIRNNLLQLPYSFNELSFKELSIRSQKHLAKDPSTINRLVIISDFQQSRDADLTSRDNEVHFVQLSPTKLDNISIDSLFVKEQSANSITLEVALSSQEKLETTIPVSIHNRKELIAKATAVFKNQSTSTIDFKIENQMTIDGILSIEDPVLNYDNKLFFSMDTTVAINVLSINDTNSEFLKRIYATNEFNYKATTNANLDYSIFSKYNLIVVNGLKELPISLGSALASFKANGGSVFVILNEEGDIASTNAFLNILGKTKIDTSSKKQRLVTAINYDHPLYTNVFDQKTDNFQYPSVSNSFKINSPDALLSFQDGTPFITAEKRLYVAASSFDIATTNFKNSPLIVPTLYNIAKESLVLPELYYTVGARNEFDILTQLPQDNILSLDKLNTNENTVIPIQRSYANKVTISTKEFPEIAGNFQVKNKDSILQNVSYNYNRQESEMRYITSKPKDGIQFHTSVSNLFDQFKEQDSIQSLWKWFVIFALLFLLMEMLILKYFK